MSLKTRPETREDVKKKKTCREIDCSSAMYCFARPKRALCAFAQHVKRKADLLVQSKFQDYQCLKFKINPKRRLLPCGLPEMTFKRPMERFI